MMITPIAKSSKKAIPMRVYVNKSSFIEGLRARPITIAAKRFPMPWAHPPTYSIFRTRSKRQSITSTTWSQCWIWIEQNYDAEKKVSTATVAMAQPRTEVPAQRMELFWCWRRNTEGTGEAMPKTFGLAMGLLTILGAAGATNCWETACFANDLNDFMRKISWAVDHVLLRKNDFKKCVRRP